MMNCPDVVDDKQLDDLSIAVTRVEEGHEPLLIEKAAVLKHGGGCTIEEEGNLWVNMN